MRTNSVICAAALVLAGCSGSGSSNQPGSSSGGLGGGTGAIAGATSSTGGRSGTNSTGGAPSLGGSPAIATGGTGGMGATSGGGNSGASGGGMPASGGAQSISGMTSAAGGGQSGSAGNSTGGAGGMGLGGAAGGSAGTAGDDFVEPPLVTSADGAYWVTTGTLTQSTSGTVDVTVNDTSTAQTWQGFGGAFNEKGWAYLSTLSAADRSAAIKLLFGRDGCNFTWGRVPMGATDYSMDRYSDDEVPSGETDTSMASFSIARDQQYLIPFAKAAQAVKSEVRFWSSPWSPPTWMKDGPFKDDSPFDGGSMKGDDATLAANAQYFVKFLQAYQGEGIHIEIVSPQNEPGYSGTYPTCAWTPATYATFVGKDLAPALAQAGLDAKIMLGTFNGGSGDTSIVSSVMGDATASADISVFGYQWGMESSVKGDQKYKLPIWQTEHECGNYPWATPFNDMVAPNDYAYAVESWGLLRDWIKAGVTAYSVWNMVLDTAGIGIDSSRVWPQNALLTVDTTKLTLSITPTYYVFRHFAEFVEPGAVVVGTTGGDALAFKNPDGTIVTVMYNSGGAKTYTLAVGGKNLQFQMPSGGWATVTQ